MTQDPILDPVGIVVWSIDVGIYDLMYSAWGWTVAEIVHFTGLCLLIGTVGMFDLRMIGLVKGLSMAALHKLVPYGVLGFVLSASSGFMFVVSTPDQYLYNPAWQTKMVLLALAGLNMALFYAVAAKRVYTLGPDEAPHLASGLFAVPMSRKFAGSPPANLMPSIVAIARPAPLTMQPMSPSSAT